MLDKLLEYAPRIIREARKSVLGVVSLIVLVLAVAAVLLFKDEANVTAKIIILSLLILSFVLLLLVVVWSGYRVTSYEHGQVEVPPGIRISTPTPRGTANRVLGVLVIGGLGLLLIVVWLGFHALFYEEARRQVTDPSSSYISGWTSTFEENGVLRGRGGTLSVYPKEVVPGFQVYVHIPKERVLKAEWTKDGGGNDFVAVTVGPP
jgi:hypothetical protein